jgi:hypothetical protein
MRTSSEMIVASARRAVPCGLIEQDALIDALLILLCRLRLPANAGAFRCSEALRLTLRELRADASRDAAAVQSLALFTLRFLRIHQQDGVPVQD